MDLCSRWGPWEPLNDFWFVPRTNDLNWPPLQRVDEGEKRSEEAQLCVMKGKKTSWLAFRLEGQTSFNNDGRVGTLSTNSCVGSSGSSFFCSSSVVVRGSSNSWPPRTSVWGDAFTEVMDTMTDSSFLLLNACSCGQKLSSLTHFREKTFDVTELPTLTKTVSALQVSLSLKKNKSETFLLHSWTSYYIMSSNPLERALLSQQFQNSGKNEESLLSLCINTGLFCIQVMFLFLNDYRQKVLGTTPSIPSNAFSKQWRWLQSPVYSDLIEIILKYPRHRADANTWRFLCGNRVVSSPSAPVICSFFIQDLSIWTRSKTPKRPVCEQVTWAKVRD